MAVSTTTFAQRMDKINSGNTTSWTVPGEGLAETRDERSFLRKSNVKMAKRSTQTKKNTPFILAIAALSGAGSVIAARWLDFTFLDDAMALATSFGLDIGSLLGGIPTSFILALTLSLLAMLVLGLRKMAVHVQTAGFFGALIFEADLVALAPDLYAQFYPQSWIVDMMASATLLT